MNCYHVYHVNPKKPPGTFELITQLYSVITHKLVNSQHPIHFITDSESLKFFQQFGIEQLYDEVNTDILDSYPVDAISTKYWATPKLWAMHHLTAPFVVYDIDIILHTELEMQTDVLYLHRESSTQYPTPTTIHTGPGWGWNYQLINAFKDSLPFNCAVVGFNNESFKQTYINSYFDWVLGSSGEYEASSNQKMFLAESGSQIVAEQWLLAALVQQHQVTARSLAPVIYGVSSFMTDFSMNPDINVTSLLDATMYHLWGAKQYQNDPDSKLHQITKENLKNAVVILDTELHHNIYHTIIEKTYSYGWK
jgi:hypothetical protein